MGRDELALCVIHDVLAEHHFVVALHAHELGEVAELDIAQLGAGAEGGSGAVAAAAAPHGGEAVVLAAGGQHHIGRCDDIGRAVQKRIGQRAGDLALIGQKVGQHGLVHEADALLLRVAADAQAQVQVHVDHGGHGPGGAHVQIAVFLSGDVDAPLLQRFDEHGVHLHIAEHQLLVAQEIADLVDVEFQKVLRLDLVGVKILQHAAAAVGLAGIARRLLLDHQHVRAGKALLHRGRAAQSANTAADDQDITFQINSFHLLAPPCHAYWSKCCRMCSLA